MCSGKQCHLKARLYGQKYGATHTLHIYRYCFTTETQIMKLPTPNFYADVNARGGLELCSNRVRHFTSWLVATLPFHEFLRITHSFSNVYKGILHAFKYISQGLKEQLAVFVTFTLNFIKCYLFCLLDLATNLHALSLMPVQMGFYQCTRELSPFTFGDSSEYPAFSESLGFTKT